MDKTLEILQHKFNIEEYQKFCMQFLNLTKEQLVLLKEQKINYPVYRDYVYSFLKIADYTDNDGQNMMVLAIKLKNTKAAERARSMQRNLVARLLEDFSIDAALVAFYSDEDTSWRLSYVNLDYEFSAEGLKKKLTPARRYSYLVGENEPNHTAKEQLKNIYLDDKNNPSIKEIEEAFKIEKVTIRFFDEYRKKYLDLKEFLENDGEFLEESDRLGFTSEEFAKKLMGQLAFLYFLQKKGWLGVKAVPHEIQYSEYVKVYDKQNEAVRNVLSKVFKRNNANMKLSYTAIKDLSDIEGDYLSGAFAYYKDKNEPDWGQWGSGDRRFIRGLFKICVKENEKARKNNIDLKEDKKNFFNDYLEPLFYSALNTKRGANEYFKLFNCKIPFLNGGLFEPIYDYDWENKHIKIPNKMFSNITEEDEFGTGILDMFDTYNFTMNEDEPLEKEVAIDPEMLGKIFENLLDVKDRKSKGAFYTPREIVHYMCQESLINYLNNETGIDREDIDNFIKLGDFIVDEDSRTMIGTKDKTQYLIPISIYDNLKIFDEALINVKIADPAVGSGAFPLGMLNEIVRIRSYLTIYMLQGLNKYDSMDLERSRSNYILKEQVMKYVIHAVDIERSAVDITKLRLWLSLIVDADVHTVNALPNLDSNIKCGNSLIDEFEGIKLFDKSLLYSNNKSDKEEYTQLKIHENKEESLLDRLEILQKELFDAKEPNKKKEIKELIEKTEWELIEYKLKKDGNDDKIKNLEFLKKEQRKPYFIWEMEFSDVFREKGGFDIIIGNPPYVGEKGNKETFRPIARTNFGEKYYQAKMDLFYFFFHKGIDIAKKRGSIAFITTNYYITATGATTLRNDFFNRTNIFKIINFNEYRIFESALGQHNIITFLQKKDEINEISYTKIISTNRKGYISDEILKSIINDNDSETESYIIDNKKLFEGEAKYIRLVNINKDCDYSPETIFNKMQKKSIEFGKISNINSGADITISRITNKHIKNFGDVYIKGEGVFVLSKSEIDNMYISTKEREIIKDFIKNSNINKYGYTLSEDKLIYLRWEDDINFYPNIKERLLRYKPILENQAQRYGENYPWYALHRPRDLKIFQAKEKILVPYRNKKNIFGYAKEEVFASRDVFYITEVDNEFDIKFILGLLNSKLFYFWLYYKGKRKGDVLELYVKPLSELPIIKAGYSEQQEIIKYIDKILDIKQSLSKSAERDIDKYEILINKIVYELYGLTQEEINIVEEKYPEEE
ncbi:Eco57I restriction-modification methylase domain-containing protein [Haloimpatiens sp. FM7330]|uniref:Eco57I restriction-modification methylase domain-containing protein n=1 Tax=Haloimpatiens sp. FM7330 TaxID=3298610 RepID=UPI003645DD37